VARSRAAELREIGAQKAAGYFASRVGQVADVVVTSGTGDRRGLTPDYLTVPVPTHIRRGERLDLIIG
jgi:hypothetical protein